MPPQPTRPILNCSLGLGGGTSFFASASWARTRSAYHSGRPDAAAKAEATLKNRRREGRGVIMIRIVRDFAGELNQMPIAITPASELKATTRMAFPQKPFRIRGN